MSRTATAPKTKLTMVRLNGRASFVHLPVAADGRMRIGLADAAKATRQTLDAQQMAIGGWGHLNADTPKGYTPFVFVGAAR